MATPEILRDLRRNQTKRKNQESRTPTPEEMDLLLWLYHTGFTNEKAAINMMMRSNMVAWRLMRIPIRVDNNAAKKGLVAFLAPPKNWDDAFSRKIKYRPEYQTFLTNRGRAAVKAFIENPIYELPDTLFGGTRPYKKDDYV